jgi:HAD superfamily hydrolase (TIGR01509 family)
MSGGTPHGPAWTVAAGEATPAAILFDVGMTLIHVDGQVLTEELARHGIPGVAPHDAVAALVLAAEARHLQLPRDRDGDGKVAACWGSLLDVDRQRVDDAFRAAVRRRDLYADLDPDAHPVLNALCQAGLPLAAVANAEGRLGQELSEAGLDRYFASVVDSALLGVEKPDPRIYLAACEQLRVSPAECWFVGDGLINDVLGAEAAGVGRGILYDRLGVWRNLPSIHRIRRLGDLLPAVPSGHGTGKERS